METAGWCAGFLLISTAWLGAVWAPLVVGVLDVSWADYAKLLPAAVVGAAGTGLLVGVMVRTARDSARSKSKPAPRTGSR